MNQNSNLAQPEKVPREVVQDHDVSLPILEGAWRVQVPRPSKHSKTWVVLISHVPFL